VSALFGRFDVKTIYGELLNAPAAAQIKVENRAYRVVPTILIQAGIKKSFGKNTLCSLALGWESQIWWDQMQMNWFSTIVMPNGKSNLTINGVVFKGAIKF
jgi:hypothetical protein